MPISNMEVAVPVGCNERKEESALMIKAAF
jgi:hypothetical protein